MKTQIHFITPDGSDREILNKDIKYAEWPYLRNGGCGDAKFICSMPLTDSSLVHTAAKKSMLDVLVKNEGAGAYDTRYSGFITGLERIDDREKQIVKITASGFAEQLKRFIITAEPAYPNTVGGLMQGLLDTYVCPETLITYDEGGIGGSFAVNGLKLAGYSVAEAMRLLSMIQGGGEYGVNANKQFYHKAVSATVGQVDIGPKDISCIDHGKIMDPLCNKVRLYGGITDSGEQYSRVVDNAPAQDTCGIREVKLLIPAIVTDGVADQFAANYLAIMKDPLVMVGYKRKTSEFDWIEEATPIPKVRTHFKGISANVGVDLPLNAVVYVLDGNKKEMRMEIGNLLDNMKDWTHHVT